MTTTELLELTRKWELGEMGNEEYVRAVWKQWRWSEWYQDKVDVCNGMLEIPRSNGRLVWRTAALFTSDRAEEVRQLTNEIEWIEAEIWCDANHDSPSSADEPKSILQRLTSLLAEAKRGIK